MAAAVCSELVSPGRCVSNTLWFVAAHAPDSQQALLRHPELQLCRAWLCSLIYWYHQNYPRNFLIYWIIICEQTPLSLHSCPSLALCYSLTSLAALQCSDFYVNGSDHQVWKCEDFSLIPNSSYLFLCWYSCQAEVLSCGIQGAQAIIMKILCRSSEYMIWSTIVIIKCNLIFLYL